MSVCVGVLLVVSIDGIRNDDDSEKDIGDGQLMRGTALMISLILKILPFFQLSRETILSHDLSDGYHNIFKYRLKLNTA